MWLVGHVLPVRMTQQTPAFNIVARAAHGALRRSSTAGCRSARRGGVCDSGRSLTDLQTLC